VYAEYNGSELLKHTRIERWDDNEKNSCPQNPRLELAGEVREEPYESDLVMREGPMEIAGYTGEGTK
jgi:hypothetical protein